MGSEWQITNEEAKKEQTVLVFLIKSEFKEDELRFGRRFSTNGDIFYIVVSLSRASVALNYNHSVN